MKNESVLKLYLLGQTTLFSEWTSLLGDKYRGALPFAWTLTDKVEDAHIIAWDGVITAKSKYYFAPVIERLKEKKVVLLLQREAYTLFNDDPFLAFVTPTDFLTVELPCGNVLPEDLLAALAKAQEELPHV